MSQSDQFDNFNHEGNEADVVSDTYNAESSKDIYNTPDVLGSPVNEDIAEEAADASVGEGIVAENVQIENNNNLYNDQMIPNDIPYSAQTIPSDNPYSAQTIPNDNPYSSQIIPNDNPYSGQMIPNDNPYSGQPVSNNNPYSGQSETNSNSYGWQTAPNGSPYSGQNVTNNNLYDGQPIQNSNLYYSDPNGNNPYVKQGTQTANSYVSYTGQQMQSNAPYTGQQTQNNAPYTGQQTQNSTPYTGQPVSNHNPYENNAYNGQTVQGDNQYGNSQFNNNQYGGVPPYGNNQYSPYAAPQKKSNTGLIIAIVVAVIVLFLIAFGALTYKVVTLYSEEKNNRQNAREEYNFDDDWDKDQDRRNEDRYNDDYDDDYGGHGYDDYGYDGYDDDYGYDDYGYDDYNYDDDEYYTLHDDIKTDLSYSVEFDYYEYDSDHENVDIIVFYPVISSRGDEIPNLDKLNSTIQSEIDFLVDYFEEEYEDYFVDGDDSYFQASSTGYVTYMDEEKMSIVFSETVYSDYYYDAFLYSINIDMENGVILDNESMINVNDDFSVEFRQKSDIQNGEISHLTMMSDQEITDHFDSSDIIVFYTPQGMEIGFNYDEGWVTVTYHDYEQYLKVF